MSSSKVVDLPLHHRSPHEDANLLPDLSLSREQHNPTPPDVLPDAVPATCNPSPSPPPPPPPPPPPLPPSLPELPVADLSTADFSHSLQSILGLSPPSQPRRSNDQHLTGPAAVQNTRHLAKIQKRASLVQRRQSNVMKLAEENDKLNEELRAMTERLEIAERRRQEVESSRGREKCGS